MDLCTVKGFIKLARLARLCVMSLFIYLFIYLFLCLSAIFENLRLSEIIYHSKVQQL